MKRLGLAMRWLLGLFGKTICFVVLAILGIVPLVELVVVSGSMEVYAAFLSSMLMMLPVILTSWMFFMPEVMKQRKEWLLLPASNAEKYATLFLFNVGCVALACLSLMAGDALRMAFQLLAGRPDVVSALPHVLRFLTPHMLDSGIFPWPVVLHDLLWLFAIHSAYVLGSALFGRQAFTVTTAAAFAAHFGLQKLFHVLNISLFPVTDMATMARDVHPVAWVLIGLYLVLTVWNYRQSYREFCKFQLTNKKWLNHELFKR